MIPVIAELLDALAHSIPDLSGAACRGHAALFDVADRHDHQGIADVSTIIGRCGGPVCELSRLFTCNTDGRLGSAC